MTQPELAAKLGIARLSVLNIEVGRRNPGHDLMVRWIEALGPDATMELWRPEPDQGEQQQPAA
jgi:DNA-binding XRE family transcriptional regulator